MPFKNSIYDNQTAILRWLKSCGHRVVMDDDANMPGFHERRSCKSKRRFADAATPKARWPSMDVYACRYCLGFHLATPKVER